MASAPTDLAENGPLPTPSGGFADWLAGLIATLGAVVLDHVVGIGDVTLFALRTLGWIVVRRQRRDVLLPAFYQIGVLSLPVVALTGLFIGMVLAVQSYAQFKALGLVTPTPVPGAIWLAQHGASENGHAGLVTSIARLSPTVSPIEANTALDSRDPAKDREGDWITTRAFLAGGRGTLRTLGFVSPAALLKLLST